MIRFWTERTRRMQAALEHHVSLRVAFTVYSFITLFLCAPAPALGSSPHAEIRPASASLGSGATAINCDIPRETLFLRGGDPAAPENGDSFSPASPAASSSSPGYRSRTGFCSACL